MNNPDADIGEYDLNVIASRKGKVRQESSLQGLTSVQAYDGKEGWQIQPFGQGSGPCAPLPFET